MATFEERERKMAQIQDCKNRMYNIVRELDAMQKTVIGKPGFRLLASSIHLTSSIEQLDRISIHQL